MKPINEDDWKDLSNEQWREYRFPNQEYVRINKPLRIIVSKNGHRIIAEGGDGIPESHYVPVGWIHLYWEGKKKPAYRW